MSIHKAIAEGNALGNVREGQGQYTGLPRKRRQGCLHCSRNVHVRLRRHVDCIPYWSFAAAAQGPRVFHLRRSRAGPQQGPGSCRGATLQVPGAEHVPVSGGREGGCLLGDALMTGREVH
jgi:hypothetical protein